MAVGVAHTQAWPPSAFPLGRTGRTPSPALKLPFFNITKPRLIFSGHKNLLLVNFQHTPILPILKNWGVASPKRHLLTSEAFLLAVSEVIFSKKVTFCGQKSRMRQETGYWGFWIAGNTTYFLLFFFFGMNTVLTDDRAEDGALSICSWWKSMHFFLRSHWYFTAVLYITH